MNAILPAVAGILSLLAFGLLFAPKTGAAAEPGAASLRVRIENVAPGGGVMRLGLYTEENYPGNSTRPVAALDLPAAQGRTQDVEFTDVPPGIYAIQVFQDINGNGKMDFNWAGLPLEPYGFSRDAHPTVAKPVFARVKITLNAGTNAPIVIHLRNSNPRDG